VDSSFTFGGREAGAYLARQPEFRSRRKKYPNGYVWLQSCWQMTPEDGIDPLVGGHIQDLTDEVGLRVVGSVRQTYAPAFRDGQLTWYFSTDRGRGGVVVKAPRPSADRLERVVGAWGLDRIPAARAEDEGALGSAAEARLSVPQLRVLRWVMALRESFGGEIEYLQPQYFETAMEQARAVETMRLNEASEQRPVDALTWSELQDVMRGYLHHRPELAYTPLPWSEQLRALLAEADQVWRADPATTLTAFLRRTPWTAQVNSAPDDGPGTSPPERGPFDAAGALTALLGEEITGDPAFGDLLDAAHLLADLHTTPPDLPTLAHHLLALGASTDRDAVRELLDLTHQAHASGHTTDLHDLTAFLRDHHTVPDGPAQPLWDDTRHLRLEGTALFLREPDGGGGRPAEAFVLAARANLPAALLAPVPALAPGTGTPVSEAAEALVAWAADRADETTVPPEGPLLGGDEAVTWPELERSGADLSADRQTQALLLGGVLPVADSGLTRPQQFRVLAGRPTAVRGDAAGTTVDLTAAALAAEALGVRLLVAEAGAANGDQPLRLGPTSGPALLIARYGGRYAAAVPGTSAATARTRPAGIPDRAWEARTPQ
jgi:hypothetical protein